MNDLNENKTSGLTGEDGRKWVEILNTDGDPFAVEETAAPAPEANAPAAPGYYESPYSSASPTYSHEFTRKPEETVKKKKERSGKGGRAALAALCVLLSLFSGFAGAWVYGKYLAPAPTTTIIYQNEGSGSGSEGTTQPASSAYSLADVVENCKPSVVEINCEIVTSNGWFGSSTGTAAGSGVIISEDGYIVTNYHVVEDARSVTVISALGKSYPATVYGYDEENDLAVLKVNETGLTPAVIADSSTLRVGDDIIAIGNPLGKLGGTVTEGIVSALDREITVDGKNMTVLQVSAAINHGNSGGGLFNTAGQLVGIVNAKSVGEDVEGLGFAIPSNLVKEVISDILEKGGSVTTTSGPVLGVTVMSITTEENAQKYRVSRLGVYIVGVTEGFGAEQAGLQPGDYIVSVDDVAVQETSDLTGYLKTKQVGDTVRVQIIRDNRMLNFDVVLMDSAG